MDILTLAMAKNSASSIPGQKGDTGNGIKSTTMNNDYTLTIKFTDGTSYTTPSIRGEKGDTGSKGAKGDKGDTGAQGIQGIQGEKGADGITYTPVIGTVTTVGSTSDATADIIVDSVAKTATFNFAIPKGANGSKGAKGDKGDTGAQGIQGIQGEKGDKGDTGASGKDGANGSNGVDGKSITAISLVKDETGAIVSGTATLSDDSTIEISITTA